MARYCRECPTELGSRNQSGYCRRHVAVRNANDPAWRDNLRAGIRRKIASDPVYAENLRHRAVEASRRNDPDALRTRWIEGRYWEKGNPAQPAGSPSRLRAGRSLSEYRLADIPAHLREDYRQLVCVQHIRAVEARRMIMEQHEAELRRWRQSVGAA